MDHHPGSASRKDWSRLQSIALIGNHLPRRCGIATFTTHLLQAIQGNVPDRDCWAIAMNDRPEGYGYPPAVRFEIDQNTLSEYSLAADLLNLNRVDVVCLQHEYGIFGGNHGSFIIELLRTLNMPVVTTLHTILRDPNNQQRRILVQLADLSDRLVVMSERSVEFLRHIYHVPDEKIVLIPHGIPDSPFVPSAHYKERFGVKGKCVILSFGLISPGKGLESIIDALPEIVEKHPNVIYMIVGATHPHLKAKEGESYRLGLQLRAKTLGVADHVLFHDRFVSEEDLVEFIGAADIYVTPYLNEAQIVSGTLAYALGSGKAVVSTHYWYAEELLAENRGRLIPFRDQKALTRTILDLLDHPEQRDQMAQRAYQYGRRMIWPEVGGLYLDTFIDAIERPLRREIPRHRLETVGRRQPRLPEIKLDHLYRMTDDTGILQHSRYTIPDRNHGYCVDDNARALIVTGMLQDLRPNDTGLGRLNAIYLGFLSHAFDPNSGRFRNFMSYDRRWLEEYGSEDSHGRALWGLGVASAPERNRGDAIVASELFHRALHSAERLTAPRAIAFSILGIHAYLRHHEDDEATRKVLRTLAVDLSRRFEERTSDGWPWCEDIVTYDNARLPQALLLAGRTLPDPRMVSVGLRSLKWLKEVQTDRAHGHFSPIGNDGWLTRDGGRALFAQQPLEAAAMVAACIEAYNCTHENEWIDFLYRSFNWYQGDNDLGLPLYDSVTGGCRDGLEARGVNENEGAESTLSWLMALLAVYNFRGRGRLNLAEAAPGLSALTASQSHSDDRTTHRE